MRAPPISWGFTTRSAPARTNLSTLACSTGAGHDEQPGVERPARERDEEVVGVTGQGGHEHRRPLDAGRAQHLVTGGILRQGGERAGVDPGSVPFDHHHLPPGPGQVPPDRLAHPAPAAQHHVAAHAGDLAVHATPPQQHQQVTFEHHADHRGEARRARCPRPPGSTRS